MIQNCGNGQITGEDKDLPAQPARRSARLSTRRISNASTSVVFSLLLGGALRVYGLGSESLWLDEASTARRVGLTYKEIFLDAGSGSQLPLYFWISKAWCALAGTSEPALRFPALAFGMLAILAVYLLGRELFDNRVGAWGAFFMAINPYFIHYSQEARPYTLFALLAMASWLFLFRWMRSGLNSDLAGYSLATAGILYTHPLAILVLPTHLAGFLLLSQVMDPQNTESSGTGPRIHRRRFSPLLAGLGIASVLFLPLLFRMGREFRLKLHGGSVADWLPVPGWGAPFETMVHYFMSPWVAVLVLVLALVPITVRSLRDQRIRAILLFCASIWAATTAFPWLVSETVTPVYFHRYSIPFLPVLLLLLGWGCSEIPRRARGVVTMALFLLTAVPVHAYHTKIDKAPWREAFQELTGSLSSGDLVIFDPGWVDQLAAYYLQSPGEVAPLSPYSLPETEGPLQAAARVWIVTETNGLLGMERLLRSGEIPGWDLALHSAPNEAYEENPRALGLSRISITRFDRRLSGADTSLASGSTTS